MRASSVPYSATYRASNSSKARAASGLTLGASPGEGTYLRGRRQEGRGAIGMTQMQMLRNWRQTCPSSRGRRTAASLSARRWPALSARWLPLLVCLLAGVLT